MRAIVGEVARGEGVTLVEACKVVPTRRGRHVTARTLLRWVTKGLTARGFEGRPVRLEAVRMPTGFLTTRAAVGRFFAALARQAAKV